MTEIVAKVWSKNGVVYYGEGKVISKVYSWGKAKFGKALLDVSLIELTEGENAGKSVLSLIEVVAVPIDEFRETFANGGASKIYLDAMAAGIKPFPDTTELIWGQVLMSESPSVPVDPAKVKEVGNAFPGNQYYAYPIEMSKYGIQHSAILVTTGELKQNEVNGIFILYFVLPEDHEILLTPVVWRFFKQGEPPLQKKSSILLS